MNFEDQLRDDLHAIGVPVLRLPDRLADRALAGARRQNRARTVVATGVAAGVAATAVATAPALWSVLPGGSAAVPASGPSCAAGAPTAWPVVTATPLDPGTELAFPHPGGGPRVVEVFRSESGFHLLDPSTGAYQAMPWLVLVSPDGSRVAVDSDGQLGVADRADLVARGADAVFWLERFGSFPQWSPDGTALLYTVVDRAGDGITYTLNRYDVATATATTTGTIDATTIIGGVGWAADSQRYLMRLWATDGAGLLGPLQYVNPDGSPGPRLDVPGGVVGEFSPSRRYVILDARSLMVDEPVCTRILDVTTGQTAAVLAPGESAIGWYDDTAFIRVDPSGQRLQVVTVETLAVLKEIDLTAAPGLAPLQIGDSAALTGAAAALGF